MYSRDILRAFAFQGLVLLLLAPLGACLVCLPLAYVSGNPNMSNSETFWVLVVPIGLFVILVFTAVVGLAWITSQRRRAWLEAAFAPLGQGLVSESQGLRGVRFVGKTTHGRDLSITFQRGPWLEWVVPTTVPGKLGITQNNRPSTRLSGLSRREALTVRDEGYEALDLYTVADHEKGVRRLLKNTAVQEALDTLLNHDNSFLIRQVLVHEGQFIYRLYRNKNLFKYEVSPEEAQAWLDAFLLVVAKAEERLA